MSTREARSPERTRAAILASSLSMVVVDRDGVVVFANPAALALFHSTMTGLLGARFGFPLVIGESTEIELVSGGTMSVAEMRALPIEWEGQPSTLAALRERKPARPPSDRRGAPALGLQSAEISRKIVHLHHEFFGRGPMQANTRVAGDTVVCLLRDSFTRAERTLIEAGRVDVVREMHRLFKAAMEAQFEKIVEGATGRSVIAHMSEIHSDPDLIGHIFVLEPTSTPPPFG